jgi:hypothetical protein
MRLDARQKTYFALRGGAAVVFLLSATVVPRGVGAGLLCMAAGLVAMLTCIGTNAGGPGERAGAVPQERWFRPLRAPQGDWPPYEAPAQRVVEGEVVRERPV